MEKTEKADVRQSGKEIFRLFQLDALFQDGHRYKKEELMKKLEVSEATLKRDIRRLKDNYRAPLVSFTSNQLPAVFKEFFPYGDDIIPLAPASFVQEWKDKIRAMMKYL